MVCFFLLSWWSFTLYRFPHPTSDRQNPWGGLQLEPKRSSEAHPVKVCLHCDNAVCCTSLWLVCLSGYVIGFYILQRIPGKVSIAMPSPGCLVPSSQSRDTFGQIEQAPGGGFVPADLGLGGRSEDTRQSRNSAITVLHAT